MPSPLPPKAPWEPFLPPCHELSTACLESSNSFTRGRVSSSLWATSSVLDGLPGVGRKRVANTPGLQKATRGDPPVLRYHRSVTPSLHLLGWLEYVVPQLFELPRLVLLPSPRISCASNFFEKMVFKKEWSAGSLLWSRPSRRSSRQAEADLGSVVFSLSPLLVWGSFVFAFEPFSEVLD